MVHDYRNPIDNSLVNITELTLKEVGDVYLREGYSMSDVFTTGILQRGRDGKLVEEGNGYQVDRSQRIRLGSADPDFTMGWRHDINYKNISLGLMITGRFEVSSHRRHRHSWMHSVCPKYQPRLATTAV